MKFCSLKDGIYQFWPDLFSIHLFVFENDLLLFALGQDGGRPDYYLSKHVVYQWYLVITMITNGMVVSIKFSATAQVANGETRCE
jgi:hypothetical protein